VFESCGLMYEVGCWVCVFDQIRKCMSWQVRNLLISPKRVTLA